jgi:UDP-glucose 4-epimerase
VARVYLTGATGFIGRGTLDALLAAGHHVSALVRSPSAARALEARGVEIVSGDLSRAHPLEGVDAVVHLAAAVDPREQSDDAHVRAVVHDATIRLADRARAARVPLFVFTSSIAAVGFQDGVVTANTPRRPVTTYGRAKADAEIALLSRASSDFRPIVLRPPTVHGPGERYNFLGWVRAVARGLFRPIGKGDNVFPLVSSANVSRAIVASVAGMVPTGVHPLADRERYSIGRVHRAIARALGIRPPRLAIPRPLAEVIARVNDAVAPLGVPLILGRARVRTLTADQPFDVTSLLDAGVPLTATLEDDVRETVAEQRRAGLV